MFRSGPLVLLPLVLSLLSLPALGQAETPYPNTATFGVPFSEDEVWYRQCKRVEHRGATDAGARAAGAAQCEASGLYYDARSQARASTAQWQAVRECALASGDRPVLMMLYANGFGVERDLDVAMHYACSLDFSAKAEMEARIAHLASMRPGSPVFDQCDDITSGHMGTICADIRETRAGRVRDARLAQMVRQLPKAARDRFEALRTAAERYADAGSAETDMQGTAAPGLAIARHGRLREQFMQAALDAAAGKLPPSSAEQVAQLDRELNRVYGEVMALPSSQAEQPERIGESTISRADVREAERRWIAYRNAFLAFGAQRSSGSDIHAIHAHLLRQRIEALRRIARYR